MALTFHFEIFVFNIMLPLLFFFTFFFGYFYRLKNIFSVSLRLNYFLFLFYTIFVHLIPDCRTCSGPTRAMTVCMGRGRPVFTAATVEDPTNSKVSY